MVVISLILPERMAQHSSGDMLMLQKKRAIQMGTILGTMAKIQIAQRAYLPEIPMILSGRDDWI